MKKSTLFIFILFFGLNNLAAQHNRGKHENFKAYKIAYITQELDLTPEEAEKFWPLYNEFGKQFYELKVIDMREQKRKIKESGGIDALSEKDANDYITGLLNKEKELVDIKKKFYKQLEGVLSPNKILKLYRAENEFNRKLLSEFRKNKSKQPNN